MLKDLAALLDKRRWRERIDHARRGAPSRSCADLHFYEDDLCLIRYRKAGRGQAIVFLCDGPATLEVYDALFAELAGAYTVIAFEAPGNGFSVPKPGYSFRFGPSNDAIARFLRAIVGERAILAFSCGGAYAALDIAARFPELCSRLVSIQAPSWEEEQLWKKRRDATGIIGVPVLGQLVFPRMMVPRAPSWYALSMGENSPVDHFCACTAAAFAEGATFALPTMFQSYLTGDTAPFDPPDQPTLAIWGALDGSHTATDKRSSERLAKNVETVMLDHVGHFPELEDPKGFKRLLAAHTQF